MLHFPDKYRFRGFPGAYRIDRGRTVLCIIAGIEGGWEHVSVHAESQGKQRVPTWSEMCYVKDFFWDEEDCVIQFHPPKSQYVNVHPFTLHLWREVGVNIIKPKS